MKKIIIKSLPYTSSVIFGAAIFYIAINPKISIYKDLLINISATLLAIPLILGVFDFIKAITDKKLNHEIFDYIKVNIDSELILLTGNLDKSLYTQQEMKQRFNALKSINTFLSMDIPQIQKTLSEKEFVGFFIFKRVEVRGKAIDEILKNPLFVSKLNNDQIISLIEIKKAISNLETVLLMKELYQNTGNVLKDHKVVNALDISVENKEHPDDYILMQYAGTDKFIVIDSGTFSNYRANECALKYYKVNLELVDVYATSIYMVIESINKWVSITNGELLFHSRMFRIVDLDINNKEKSTS